MKTILTLIFSLAFSSLFAQNPSDSINCSDYLVHDTDEFTGSKHIYSTPFKVLDSASRTGIEFRFLSNGKYIIFIMEGIGKRTCVEEGGIIILLFEDGSKYTYASMGKFNCESQATVYFRGPWGLASHVTKFKNKPLKAVRLSGVDATFQAYFTKDDQQEFMQIFRCIDHVKK